MKKVEAYQSLNGEIFATEKECIENDINTTIGEFASEQFSNLIVSSHWNITNIRALVGFLYTKLNREVVLDFLKDIHDSYQPKWVDIRNQIEEFFQRIGFEKDDINITMNTLGNGFTTSSSDLLWNGKYDVVLTGNKIFEDIVNLGRWSNVVSTDAEKKKRLSDYWDSVEADIPLEIKTRLSSVVLLAPGSFSNSLFVMSDTFQDTDGLVVYRDVSNPQHASEVVDRLFRAGGFEKQKEIDYRAVRVHRTIAPQTEKTECVDSSSNEIDPPPQSGNGLNLSFMKLPDADTLRRAIGQIVPGES